MWYQVRRQTNFCLTPLSLIFSTADFSRRRFDQHRRVIELQKATKHLSPPSEIADNRWSRVSWYYSQYGDVDGGGGVAISSALRLKHDLSSDSFVEFIFPKVMLLIVGITSTIVAASSRFPSIENTETPTAAAFLNPDQFGSRSKLYVLSSIIQLVVIQIWAVFIVSEGVLNIRSCNYFYVVLTTLRQLLRCRYTRVSSPEND